MENSVSHPKILLDADVFIHIFKAEKISLLTEMYEGRLYILDVVLNELRNNRTINAYLDMIFKMSGIKEIVFTTKNQKLFMEFLSLKNKIDGAGERASLVYCKYYNDIIASSNTKDIKNFCEEYGMVYLTTLDIFCVAVGKGIISEAEADICIGKITKDRGSHLCCNTIHEHTIRHFQSEKMYY